MVYCSFEAGISFWFLILVSFSTGVVPIFSLGLAFAVLFVPGTLGSGTRYFIYFPLSFLLGLIWFELSFSQQYMRVFFVLFRFVYVL